MKRIGIALVPATIVLAGVNIVLAGATTPVLILEAFVVGHACIVARYWWNRAEGEPAEYYTETVTDAWQPEHVDLVMLIPTIGTLLFTFAWLVTAA
jgi:hypothetical protein